MDRYNATARSTATRSAASARTSASARTAVSTVRQLTPMGLPPTVPAWFVPADEGSGILLRNYGNMGKPNYRLVTAATQWRGDGKFTTNNAGSYEHAWDICKPEDAVLLDKLFFFRDCTAGSPGIGGNIALMAFQITPPDEDLTTTQARVFSTGISGIAVTSVAWQITCGVTGNFPSNIAFFHRDGTTEVSSSMFPLNADYDPVLEYYSPKSNHVVIILDALNKGLYAWLDGVPVTISGATVTAVTNRFKKFTNTTLWDTNGVTITLGNSCNSTSAPGSRADIGTNKNLAGNPLSDFLYADVTALDSVLAARRDSLALAIYNSTRGTLSNDVITLLTPP